MASGRCDVGSLRIGLAVRAIAVRKGVMSIESVVFGSAPAARRWEIAVRFGGLRIGEWKIMRLGCVEDVGVVAARG